MILSTFLALPLLTQPTCPAPLVKFALTEDQRSPFETWHPSWVRSSCRARKYHKKLRVLASLALDVSYWIQLQHTLKQHWGNRCHLFGRGVQSCSMPAGAKIPSNRVFSHGVSKCGPWTRKSSITWELVRRVHSQTPPQNLWGQGPAICWKNFQGFWSTLQFENYWL